MESATANINGLTYKIGARGWAFYMLNGEWKRSERPASEIKKAIKKQTETLQ